MKKFKPIKIIAIFCIITISIAIFQKPIIAFATDLYTFTTDEHIGLFYDTNQSWLISNNFITDALHTIGWAIIKFLKLLVDACETLYKKSVGLLDFTNYQELNDLIDEYKLAYAAIMTLSVLYLGYSMIISHDKKLNVFKSLFLSIFCFSALAGIMVELNTSISTFAADTVGSGNSSTKVICEQTYDLLKGIKKKEEKFSIEKNKHLTYCRIKSSQFELIDINEVMNYGSTQLSENASSLLSSKLSRIWSISGKEKDEFKAQVDYLIEQTEYPDFSLGKFFSFGGSVQDTADRYAYKEYLSSLKELPAGSSVYMLTAIDSGYELPFNTDTEKNGFMNEFYYRYHVDFFPIIITLIAYIIVYIAMSYKAIRCIYELAIKKILAVLYSADINGTQKTMKILSSIRDGYIIIMLSSILIKAFTLMNSYLNNNLSIDNPNIKMLVKCILLIMIALAVVDGPDIIQQLTGIDAGLSGGVGKMMAAYHMGRGAARAATAAPRGLARIAGNKLRDHQLANEIEKAHENKRAIDNASVQDVQNNKDTPNNEQDDNNLSKRSKDFENGPNQANIDNNGTSQNKDDSQNIGSENGLDNVDDPQNIYSENGLDNVDDPQNIDSQNQLDNIDDSQNIDSENGLDSIDEMSQNSNSENLSPEGLDNRKSSENISGIDESNSNISGINGSKSNSQLTGKGIEGNVPNKTSPGVSSLEGNSKQTQIPNISEKKDNLNPNIVSKMSDNITESNISDNLNQSHYNSNKLEGMNNESIPSQRANSNSNLGTSTNINPSPGTYNLNGQTYRNDSPSPSVNKEEDLMRNDNLFNNH